jgi:hypothetical protein
LKSIGKKDVMAALRTSLPIIVTFINGLVQIKNQEKEDGIQKTWEYRT